MKASVLFEQGKPLSVEELELEAPRAGEVTVRMAASGVCHSCLHAADGSWKGVPVPIVLGDEGAGVVEQVGAGVDLEVGDHVILSWAPTCGRCHYCVIGRPNLCERRQPGKGVLPDGTTRMSLRGQPVYHYGHLATYASRTVVHESCAIPIDKTVPLDKAALMRILVDTHLILWATARSRRLTRDARTLLEDTSNGIHYSAASLWEIATKARLGRLPAALDVAADLPAILTAQGFDSLDITVAHGQHAGSLAGPHPTKSPSGSPMLLRNWRSSTSRSPERCVRSN